MSLFLAACESEILDAPPGITVSDADVGSCAGWTEAGLEADSLALLGVPSGRAEHRVAALHEGAVVGACEATSAWGQLYVSRLVISGKTTSAQSAA